MKWGVDTQEKKAMTFIYRVSFIIKLNQVVRTLPFPSSFIAAQHFWVGDWKACGQNNKDFWNIFTFITSNIVTFVVIQETAPRGSRSPLFSPAGTPTTATTPGHTRTKQSMDTLRPAGENCWLIRFIFSHLQIATNKSVWHNTKKISGIYREKVSIQITFCLESRLLTRNV
jgi:hypothetical protein